jgi:L-threonylcarbamoyladenylate synthase
MNAPRVLAVSPEQPRGDRIREAIDTMRAGGIVAIPTETFYGLATDAFLPEALLRVNRLKGKTSDSPILLLLADRGQVGQVARDLPDAFDSLAERFWPGPLTMVVHAAPSLPPEISGGRGTVGVRVPGLALPRLLAEGLGRPITGVSANAHGKPPSRNAEDVVRSIPEGLDLVLDGGPCPGGAPSTVLDLSSGAPRILRQGIVPLSALEPFLSGTARASR